MSGGCRMDPREAIEAATLGSATAIGHGEQLGSLEPGKIADLLVVRGDPTANISEIRQVERVFRRRRDSGWGGSGKTRRTSNPVAGRRNSRTSLVNV